MSDCFEDRGDTLLLRVKARPGAKKDRLVSVHGAELVVDIRAPAEDGKASDVLLKFLAETLSISRADIRFHSGEFARHKLLRVTGSARSVLENKLLELERK